MYSGKLIFVHARESRTVICEAAVAAPALGDRSRGAVAAIDDRAVSLGVIREVVTAPNRQRLRGRR
jgi:hypothetical protein